MLNKFLLSTALVAVSSTAGMAQGLTGAELGIEYRDVTDVEDLGSVTYFGSAEFDAYYGIRVAVDASAYDFEIGPSGIANLTAHAIYGVNPSTDVGLFLGWDFTDGSSSGVFGAELAYDFGVGDFEVYLGSAEDGIGRDLTIYGAAATYGLANNLSFAANVDAFTGDGFSANAVEIGGFYTLPNGPQFGATIGIIDQEEGSSESSDTFFGIQASIALGPDGGTTFGRRGAYEAVKASPPEPATP